MALTWTRLMEKIDSGKVKLIDGVLKSNLAEYSVDNLDNVSVTHRGGAERYNVQLKALKYTNSGNTVFLKSPNMRMEVYLRFLGLRGGELCNEEIYVGELPLERIAEGLGKFKEAIASARNAAYERLKTAETVEGIEGYSINAKWSDVRQKIKDAAIKASADIEEFFNEVDLREQLEKNAKELFAV
jgi:hypothetical protein